MYVIAISKAYSPQGYWRGEGDCPLKLLTKAKKELAGKNANATVEIDVFFAGVKLINCTGYGFDDAIKRSRASVRRQLTLRR